MEIWPTSVIIPAGYRLAVTILGRYFEFPPGDSPWPQVYGMDMKGLGVFLHDEPAGRPAKYNDHKLRRRSSVLPAADLRLPLVCLGAV